MDRSMWTNRSRRTTFMGERIRSGNSKIVNKCVSKPSGVLSANKENESRTKRNAFGDHAINSKNVRQEVSSRRSITRRLSFHKTDMESVDESPFHCAEMQHENCQDVDESMLYPLNSTRVMGSSPSPFRLDLFQKGDQKKGYPSIVKHLNSSKYDNIRNNSNEKKGLSDQTKKLLKKMGIETSPDLDVVKQDSLKRIPEKNSEEIREPCIVNKENLTWHQTSEVSGKTSGIGDAPPVARDEKGTQTTPLVEHVEVARKLPEGSDDLISMMETLNHLHLRHFQEREKLNIKQKKEVEEFMSHYNKAHKGDLNELDGNLRSGRESEESSSMPQPGALISYTESVNNVQSVGIEIPSISQVPSENVSSTSRQMTVQTNEASAPIITVSEEPLAKLTSIFSPQNCIVSVEGAPCTTLSIATDSFTGISKSPVVAQGALENPGQLENPFCPQNWRRQEVSLIDTPQAGRWLVTEDLDEDALVNSTPTLGLNSMLQGMSIQGQQPFLETPATRRLVTKRILKEVESLFY